MIEDIAELRGIKQTRVVTEILEESRPQLEVVRDALKTIKNNEAVSLDQVLSKMLGNSFENLSEVFKGLDK